jgi:sugar phosphate permease
VVRRQTSAGRKGDLEPFKATPQFVLAVAALFCVYSMNELVRLSTPIALKALNEGADSAGATGITFSVAGLASAFSVLFVAPLLFTPGRLAKAFGAACSVGAVGALVLAVTETVPLYVAGFMLVALVVSALVPAINTHIAGSVTRSRRGTGFGIAATVQALSFAVGPASAALFAAVSLDLGFVVLACLFLALGLVMFSAIREQGVAARA